MSPKKFLNVFLLSFKDLFRNPLIVLPSLLIFSLLFFLSKFSLLINSNYSESLNSNVSFAVFSIIYFSLLSYFFCILIGFSSDIYHKRPYLPKFFSYGNKFFFRNFAILLSIAFISWAATFILTPIVYYFGKALGFSDSAAILLFFLLYFVFLSGAVIFLAFSSFFLVIKDSSFFDSIRLSFEFVKRNYLQTLSVIILFFIIFSVLYYFKTPLSTAIEYLLAIPYFSLVLSRFVLSEK